LSRVRGSLTSPGYGKLCGSGAVYLLCAKRDRDAGTGFERADVKNKIIYIFLHRYWYIV